MTPRREIAPRPPRTYASMPACMVQEATEILPLQVNGVHEFCNEISDPFGPPSAVSLPLNKRGDDPGLPAPSDNSKGTTAIQIEFNTAADSQDADEDEGTWCPVACRDLTAEEVEEEAFNRAYALQDPLDEPGVMFDAGQAHPEVEGFYLESRFEANTLHGKDGTHAVQILAWTDDEDGHRQWLGKFRIGSDEQGNIDMSKLESRLFDMKYGDDWE